MNELRKDNLRHADVLQHVNAYLESNSGYYGALNVRCVSALQNGKWMNVVCFMRVQPRTERPKPNDSKRYPTAHLLDETTELSQLVRLARELMTGTITVDGEAVFLGGVVELRNLAFQPSGSDYSDLPGYLYQTNQAAPILPGQLQEPLLGGIALRYYPNVYSAIPEWIGLRQFNELSDARLGYVWLFLPECRAYFSSLTKSAGQLKVAIARGERESTRKFHVIGNWKAGSSLLPISSAIPGASVDIQVPRDATSIDLYLVDETDTTFDYHQESEHWAIGQRRILPATSVARETLLGAAGAEEVMSRRVFIVHGHDDVNLLKLAKLLEQRFDLEPVILRDEPGIGRTLIEKLEQEIPTCSYSFILMSPDDNVRVTDWDGTMVEYAQARPNVLFEMGMIFGQLGRPKMCILFKRGTKLHSDLEGIHRVEFLESVEEVVLPIESELQAAGLLKMS